MDAFHVADKSNQKLKAKLTEEEREREKKKRCCNRPGQR